MRHLKIALSQYNTEHGNPYFRAFPETQKYAKEELDWCGVFVAWCLSQAGILDLPHNFIVARNWMKYSQPVGIPEVGDIAVFWRDNREDSWRGHVGFYIAHDDHLVFVLGGNQRGRVSIRGYDRNRLLGFRQVR